MFNNHSIKLIKASMMILGFSTLIGCSADVSEYQKRAPKINIQEYFNGELVAWGIIQDRDKVVKRRFCVELTGSWVGNKGVLDETFYFDDGEVTKRIWYLQNKGNGSYTGQADDVNGVANGKEFGMAFQWKYSLSVPIDGNVIHFDMDDWMYQMDENRLFNRTSMSKLGLDLAEITLFFDKTQRECATQSIS